MAKTYKTGVVVTGDAKGGVKAIKLTQEQLKTLNKVVKKSGSRFDRYRQKVSQSAKTLSKFTTAGLTLATAATAAMIKVQLKEIDTLVKTADAFGITTEKLVQYRYAAELSGVSNDKFDKSMKKMITNLADAANGTGEAKDALKQLGLNVDDLIKMTPDQQFAAIGDAMGTIENKTVKAGLAYDIFGRNGVELVKTLDLGTEGLAEFADKADIAGINLSRVDAAKIEMANDAMTDAGKLMSGFAKQVTVKVSPIVKALAEELFGAAKEAGGVGTIADSAFNIVVKSVGFAADVVHGFKTVVLGVFQALTMGIAEVYSISFNSLAMLDSVFTKLLNKLPKSIGGGSFKETSMLKNMKLSLDNVVTDYKQQLKDLVEEPLPSEKIENLLAKMQDEVDETANVIAKANKVSVQGSADYIEQLKKQREAEAEVRKNKIALHKQAAAQAKLEAKAAKNKIALQKQAVAQAKLEAKAYQEAWGEAIKRIDASFADSWRTLIHKGKLDFDGFKDSIIKSFGDLLANLAHQGITKKILINLGVGGVGVPGVASASAQGGSGLSLSSVASGFSSFLGSSSIGQGLATGAANIGKFFGASSTIGGNALGNLATTSNMAMGLGGIGGGMLSNALGLSGKYSGVTGSIGTAVGTALLTPILGPLAPFAGSFIGSALGGLIGNKKPSNKEGNATYHADSTSAIIGGQTGKKFSQDNRNAAQSIADNIYGAINALEYFTGKESRTGFTVGVGDRDGKYLRFNDPSSGETRELARTDDPTKLLSQAAEHFAKELSVDSSIFKQLQLSGEVLTDTIQRVIAETAAYLGEGKSLFDDIEGYSETLSVLSSVFAREGETLSQTITRIANANHSLELIGLVDGFTQATATISQSIADFAGGAQALASNSAAYYQAFFSKQERFDVLGTKLSKSFEQLGLEVPKTREGFRALVESLDLTTESGQKQAAQLITLAPQMDKYYQQLGSIGGATDKAADSVTELVENLHRVRASSARAQVSLISAIQTYNENGSLGAMLAAQSDRLVAAQEAESSLFESQRERYEAAMQGEQSISEFLATLQTGNLSTLTNAEKQIAAKGDFDRALVSGEGAKATAAAGNYLSIARKNHASGDAYQAVFLDVNRRLSQMGTALHQAAAPSGNGGSAIRTASAAERIVETQNEQIKLLKQQIAAFNIAEQLGKLSETMNASVFELAKKFGLNLQELAQDMDVNAGKIDASMVKTIAAMADLLKIDNQALLDGLGANIEGLPISIKEQLGLLNLAKDSSSDQEQVLRESQVQVMGDVLKEVTQGNKKSADLLNQLTAAVEVGNADLLSALKEQRRVTEAAANSARLDRTRFTEEIESLKRSTHEQTDVLTGMFGRLA